MRPDALTSESIKWLGVALLILGVFGVVWAATADPNGTLNRGWIRYTRYLDRKLRLMFIFTPGAVVATLNEALLRKIGRAHV